MNRENQALGCKAGYAMAALLVAIGVMAVFLTAAMPVWHQMVQREKEEELVFRGQQVVRAIGLFQRKYAASYPPSLDVLVEQRFLRKKYKDPMTADGEFQVLYQMGFAAGGQLRPGQAGAPGQQGQQGSTQGPGSAPFGAATAGAFGRGTLGPRGGVIGVASKSTDTSIRLYNGRNHYNEWQFVFAPLLGPGRGMQRPGMPGMGGRGGRGGMGPGQGGRFGPGAGGGFGGFGGQAPQPQSGQPGGQQPRQP